MTSLIYGASFAFRLCIFTSSDIPRFSITIVPRAKRQRAHWRTEYVLCLPILPAKQNRYSLSDNVDGDLFGNLLKTITIYVEEKYIFELRIIIVSSLYWDTVFFLYLTGMAS